MPEREFELVQIGVDYVCDKCGDGVMKSTGLVFTRMPPIYQHKCSKCGHVAGFEECYPRAKIVKKEPV